MPFQKGCSVHRTHHWVVKCCLIAVQDAQTESAIRSVCRVTHRQWMVLTAEGWILHILSETVLKLLGKHLRCTVPSLFLLWLAFYFICCRSLFWGQFTTKIRRPNGCGESCSGVNSSVSAGLKPADDVACRHVNCLRPVLGRKARQLFQQPVSLLRSPVAKAVFRPTQVIQHKCRFSPLFSPKWGLSV